MCVCVCVCVMSVKEKEKIEKETFCFFDLLVLKMRNDERIVEKNRGEKKNSYNLVPYIIHTCTQIQDGKLAKKNVRNVGGEDKKPSVKQYHVPMNQLRYIFRPLLK